MSLILCGVNGQREIASRPCELSVFILHPHIKNDIIIGLFRDRAFQKSILLNATCDRFFLAQTFCWHIKKCTNLFTYPYNIGEL